MLAQLYNWPPQIVARMTPYQQLVYLVEGGGAEAGVLKFRNEKDYLEWLAKRNLSK